VKGFRQGAKIEPVVIPFGLPALPPGDPSVAQVCRRWKVTRPRLIRLIEIGRLDQLVRKVAGNGVRYTMVRDEVLRIEREGVRGFIIPPKAAP
jgi:hypothetical protein